MRAQVNSGVFQLLEKKREEKGQHEPKAAYGGRIDTLDTAFK